MSAGVEQTDAGQDITEICLCHRLFSSGDPRGRLWTLFTPVSHLLKHLFCAPPRFRLRLFSIRFALPVLFSFANSKSNFFLLCKVSGMHLWRSVV